MMSDLVWLKVLGVQFRDDAPWASLPPGSVVLSAAGVEKLRGITDPGPAPCSCDRCYCGNDGDAERMGAWREQKRIHDEISRLLDGDRS